MNLIKCTKSHTTLQGCCKSLAVTFATECCVFFLRMLHENDSLGLVSPGNRKPGRLWPCFSGFHCDSSTWCTVQSKMTFDQSLAAILASGPVFYSPLDLGFRHVSPSGPRRIFGSQLVERFLRRIASLNGQGRWSMLNTEKSRKPCH